MSMTDSLLLFGIPSLWLYFATRFCIYFIHQQLRLPLLVCWFISGVILVFIPLFILSLVFYKMEENAPTFSAFRKRFRLQAMTLSDWLWTVGAILFIGITTTLIIIIAQYFNHSFSISPPFLSAKVLTANEMWILWAWIPLFFFNVFGEEFMWRGYIFPRQELTHGKHTWLIHGLLWLMFHLSFGWNLLLILCPIIFTISYVVQRKHNTWIGILIHGVINGGGFLSLSLGLA